MQAKNACAAFVQPGQAIDSTTRVTFHAFVFEIGRLS
jgi:hypothetical protein